MHLQWRLTMVNGNGSTCRSLGFVVVIAVIEQRRILRAPCSVLRVRLAARPHLDVDSVVNTKYLGTN